MKQYLKMSINFVVKILGYTVILMFASLIFQNTIYIDNSKYGIWCLVASFIIYLFNRTIKPFLVWLTIPITGVTLGLFYPFINLIILKLTSLILGNHFKIYGIWFAVVASILISILNIFLDHFLSKVFRTKDVKK